MRMFIVPIHTEATVVVEDTHLPFTTRTELAFGLEDTVFDPVSCYNRPDDFPETFRALAAQNKYGFARPGFSGAVYTLIVNGSDVKIL